MPLAIDSDPEHYLALHAALDEPVVDAALSVRERQIRREVRAVVATSVATSAAMLDRKHLFAHDGYQALAASGLAGLSFPVLLGGTGDTTTAYAVAVEEIAAGCGATSLVYMTQANAAYPIMIAGSADLARRYVPSMLDGSRYGSLAVTEPDAGSDASGLRTSAAARPVGGAAVEYRLAGTKTFITTADRAEVIVCFATVDPAAGRDGITAFVVDGHAPGITRGRPLRKMGMHGSTTAELFFDDTPVPVTHRLGGDGGGWEILLRTVTRARIGAAAQGIGLARGAYAHALAALHQMYGKALPAPVASECADMRARILQGRLLLLAVTREVDRQPAAPDAQISMLKQACTDVGWQVSLAAVTVLGGCGDLAGFGVERYLRDAKVTQIYDGANEIQRLLVARDTGRRIGTVLR